MLFVRRRWALRVTETMNLEATNPLTTELVSMIIQGSKQIEKMMKSSNVKIAKPQLILMSAASLRSNRSALQRLMEECRLTARDAGTIAQEALKAAGTLAREYKFDELLRSPSFQPSPPHLQPITMTCDVCNASITEQDAARVSAEQFRALLTKGFGIDETNIRMLVETGIPREQAIELLTRQYSTSQSDWLLCTDCAGKAKNLSSEWTR
ncbi:MAG: hypothetical protein A3F74_08580 [Betaproteobacteria bacterium RIFCSPLOWO2_12_FULL_62_58]|nr:MAG: hypothetical protein A3F74_08580 [Betaproteobacteria bacterium RIFCSPLOWO2_12_FULL_62_58]